MTPGGPHFGVVNGPKNSSISQLYPLTLNDLLWIQTWAMQGTNNTGQESLLLNQIQHWIADEWKRLKTDVVNE